MTGEELSVDSIDFTHEGAQFQARFDEWRVAGSRWVVTRLGSNKVLGAELGAEHSSPPALYRAWAKDWLERFARSV